MRESDLRLVVESADSEVSQPLQEAFFADIAARYPDWEPGSSASVDASELVSPQGTWLVAYLADLPVGCGGLQRVDAKTAEIRRVFLDHSARGRGIGRALLAELETRASRLGYRCVRLTTGDRQSEALGLFRSAGYDEVPPFSDGAFTRYWMEKPVPRLVDDVATPFE